MSNCDNHSLKYKIISGDLSNFIWSLIFLTFVLCVLVGCLLDHTLLPHSGSLSRLLLGWIHIIVLCIHLGSMLRNNSFSHKKKSKSMSPNICLLLFTFAPFQINYTGPDHGYFLYLSKSIDELKLNLSNTLGK